MPRAENNSKAQLAQQYKTSASTVRRWINFLRDNYKRLNQERNDPEYLAFDGYKSNCNILTPLQIKVFKKHYGEP